MANWVAVGNSGILYTSSDGYSWTDNTQAITDFFCVDHDPDTDRWVAAGRDSNFDFAAMYSDDGGSTWSNTNNWALIPETSVSIKYHGGTWVVVLTNGGILNSSDGINWSEATDSGTTTTENLQDIDHDGSNFVAVSFNGTIILSSDGDNWSTPSSVGTSADLHGVAFGPDDAHPSGIWLAVGQNGTLLYSDDGADTWQHTDDSGSIVTNDLEHVSVDNENDTTANEARFVAVGENATVTYSTDILASWTDASGNYPNSNTINGVDFYDGYWVVAGGSGIIERTADLVNWDNEGFVESNAFRDVSSRTVTFAANYIVGAGANEIYISEDGTSWDLISVSLASGDIEVYSAAHDPDNDRWVAVGSDPSTNSFRACYSDNGGSSWTETNNWGLISVVYDVDYHNGTWVVVGGDGDIITSTNGIDWSTATDSGLTSPDNLLWIVYADGKWVATGNNGNIITSTDGDTWSLASSTPTTASVRSANHDTSGMWVATAGVDEIWTSSDGDTWSLVSSPGVTAIWYGGVHFGGDGRWIAVGDGGTIATSINGTDWSEVTDSKTVTTDTFWDIVFTNGLWVAVTPNNIYTSSDGDSWTSQQAITGAQGVHIGEISDTSDYVNVLPGSGSLTFTGNNATIQWGSEVQPSVGSLTTNTYDPTIDTVTNETIDPSAGSLTTTTYDPTVDTEDNADVAPSAGSWSSVGLDPTIDTSGETQVSPDPGSLALSGNSPLIHYAYTLHIDNTATLTTATYDPVVDVAMEIQPDPASISLVGLEAKAETTFRDNVLFLGPHLFLEMEEISTESTATDSSENQRHQTYVHAHDPLGSDGVYGAGQTLYAEETGNDHNSHIEIAKSDNPWYVDQDQNVHPFTLFLYIRNTGTTLINEQYLMADHTDGTLFLGYEAPNYEQTYAEIPTRISDENWHNIVVRGQAGEGEERYLDVWVDGVKVYESPDYGRNAPDGNQVVFQPRDYMYLNEDFSNNFPASADYAQLVTYDYAISDYEMSLITGHQYQEAENTPRIQLSGNDVSLYIPSLEVPIRTTDLIEFNTFQPEIVPFLWSLRDIIIVGSENKVRRINPPQNLVEAEIDLPGEARHGSANIDLMFMSYRASSVTDQKLSIFDIDDNEKPALDPSIVAEPWAVAVSENHFAVGTRRHTTDANYGSNPSVSEHPLRVFRIEQDRSTYTEIDVSYISSVRSLAIDGNDQRLAIVTNESSDSGVVVFDMVDEFFDSSYESPRGTPTKAQWGFFFENDDIIEELYIGYHGGVLSQKEGEIGLPYVRVEDMAFAPSSFFHDSGGKLAVVGEKLYIIELSDNSITTLIEDTERYARTVGWLDNSTVMVGIYGDPGDQTHPSMAYYDIETGNSVSGGFHIPGPVFSIERPKNIETDTSEPPSDDVAVGVSNTPVISLNGLAPAVEAVTLISVTATPAITFNTFDAEVVAGSVTIHPGSTTLTFSTHDADVVPRSEEITPSTAALPFVGLEVDIHAIETQDAFITVDNVYLLTMQGFDVQVVTPSFQVILTSPTSSVVTARDAEELRELDLGTLFRGQDTSIHFCIANRQDSSHRIRVAAAGDDRLTDLVEFSVDGINYHSKLTVPITPNGISDVIEMSVMAVPESIPIGQNSFIVSIQPEFSF